MKVLIFGDVYGRIGRAALKKEFPGLKEKFNPDFVIANVENCTSGRGPIEKHILELESLGIDVMTGGDHVFDNLGKIQDYLEADNSKLIRPANFREYDGKYNFPGKGYTIVEKDGKKLLVIHVLGEIFMNNRVDNPLLKAKQIIEETKNIGVDAVVIDFHKETTAEGYGLAHFLDGEASFVYGTHTHVQTNDELILPNGTGILSDVGMNGALYSVIGAEYSSVEKRFLTGFNKGKIEQSLDKNYVVSGVVVEIGDDNKCIGIEKIRIRGEL